MSVMINKPHYFEFNNGFSAVQSLKLTTQPQANAQNGKVII